MSFQFSKHEPRKAIKPWYCVSFGMKRTFVVQVVELVGTLLVLARLTMLFDNPNLWSSSCYQIIKIEKNDFLISFSFLCNLNLNTSKLHLATWTFLDGSRCRLHLCCCFFSCAMWVTCYTAVLQQISPTALETFFLWHRVIFSEWFLGVEWILKGDIMYFQGF